MLVAAKDWLLALLLLQALLLVLVLPQLLPLLLLGFERNVQEPGAGLVPRAAQGQLGGGALEVGRCRGGEDEAAALHIARWAAAV